jgi:hypothetical protein
MMRSDTTFRAIHHIAPNSMEKKCMMVPLEDGVGMIVMVDELMVGKK